MEKKLIRRWEAESKQGVGIKKSAKKSFQIFKTDDDKRLVFGWASVSIRADGEQLLDRQQDMIDPEDLEEMVYNYVLNFRDAGEEHIDSMRKRGRLVESCVFTEEKQAAMGIPPGVVPVAWWIGFKIDDDAAWAKIKNGTYRMFSIEGKAERVPVEKAAVEPTGCGVLVVRDGKVLVGTRREAAHHGELCGPGGHIESGETPEVAARRETMEEFGIRCGKLRPLGVQDGGRYGGSAIFLCSDFEGEPKTDETEMTDPRWLSLEEIGQEQKVFQPFRQSLRLFPVAKSFQEVAKMNDHHDALGRFA